MLTIGYLLIAWGLLSLILSAGRAVTRRMERRRIERWSRTPHGCQWKARTIAGYTGAQDAATGAWTHTLVLEECAVCPRMRLVPLEGRWAMNRLGDPVNLAGEGQTLERAL